jgi:hypothetical protein
MALITKMVVFTAGIFFFAMSLLGLQKPRT